MTVYSVIRLKGLNVVAERTIYGLRTGKASEHPKTLLSKLNNELADSLQPTFPTILSIKRAKTDQCLYFVLHSFRRLKEDRGKKMNVSKLTFQ